MKQLFLIAALVSTCLLQGAALKVASYNFKEKCSGKNTDPGFTRLTDGDTKKRIVSWHNRLFGGWPVTINFQFAGEIKLSAAKVYIYRGQRSHGIKDIKVFGKNGVGKYIPLASAVLKHPYQRPKNEPAHSCITLKSEDDTAVSEIQIQLSGTGHYMGLTEVAFEGTAIPPKKVKLEANPMDRLIAGAKPGLRLYRSGDFYILENDRSIYSIAPAYAGSVNYAYDKVAKRNLLRYAAPGEGYGPAFDDRLWGGSANKNLYRYREYKAEVLADTPQKKQIKVSGTGRSGAFSNVTIEKTYTLEKDSSLLRVDFNLINSIVNVVPLRSGYWMSAGVAYPENYLRILPGPNCVETGPSTVKEFSSESLSSGWFGSYCKGVGLAFLVPYELVKSAYYWRDTDLYGTTECKLGIYPINAGNSLSFSMHLAPFSGVEIPEKVNDLAAGSFDLKADYDANIPKTAQARFRFFREGNYTLRLSSARVGKGKVVFKPFLTVPVKKGTFARIPFTLPDRWGTVVYKAEIFEGKVCRFFMEKVVNFGRSTGIYNLTVDGEKRPDASNAGAKLNLNFNSKKVTSGKAIKWGTPLAQKDKPKVLAVNMVKGGIRDMIDISERFDIDLTTNFIAGMWSLSLHTQGLNIKTCIAELAKKLKQKYDCIVISANVWNFLDKNTAAILMNQVEQGTGLIVTTPEGHPEALAKLFKKSKGKMRKSTWKSTGNSPLTAAIAFEAIPESTILPYTVKGKVLAAAAKKLPVLVECQYGKGKVYLFTYGVRNPSSRGGKYNPASSYHLPHMSYAPPKATWAYEEYIMALYGRVLYSAAGVKTGVEGVKFTAAPGKAVLQLKSEKALTGELTLTLRNRYSEVCSEIKKNVALKAGLNTLTFALAKDEFAGLHIVDAILRQQGCSLWWGSAAYQNRGAGKLTAVKVASKIYRSSESVKVAADFTGRGTLTHRLFDTYGNEMERFTGKNISIPLANCKSKVAFLVTELGEKGKVYDKIRTRIAIHGAPDRKVFTIMQGWPGLSGSAQNWNLDLYLKQLRKFGYNMAGGARSYRGTPIAEEALRNNNILYGSTQYSYGLGGPRPMKDISAKEKDQMIRIPCLSAPGFKEKLEKRPAPLTGAYPYGVIDVQGADEANEFSNWDGCFSEHCMKELRKWLKKEYTSLDALNKSWATSFKSWDEVIPSTSAEARKMKSFASWMDHRTFNDWNRADALRALVAGLHSVDPELTYSFSGTQNTNPWNAWDYWQLMPHLKTLTGYGGEQAVQHRSFSKGNLRNAGWVGYDRDYANQSFRIFQGLLNGSTGISIYGNFNIDPAYNISGRGEELIRAINKFRNGPAEILMRSVFTSSPVAFHYSPASNKSAWFTGFSGVASGDVQGFRLTFSDAGLPYDYVAYGELEKGKVPAKYKVVVLPCSTSLSDKEVATLRRFVKEGGTLIADFMPGIYDNHGARREKAPLLDVFGLKSYGKVERASAPLNWGKASFKVAWVDKSAVPSTAQALASVGNQKAVFVNRYGKGKAVYLGTSVMMTLGEWQEMRYSKANRPGTKVINGFIASLLKDHAIRPVATAPDMPSAILGVRNNGAAFLLGVYRNPDNVTTLPKEAAKHKIMLRSKFHIYDVLAGKYLGYGSEYLVSFAPDTQGLYALLPYKAGKLETKVSRSGRKITLDCALETPGNRDVGHIFRIRVFDGQGKESEAFSTLLHAKTSKGSYSFTLPLNGSLQKGSAEITDVMTGTRTEVRF